MLKKLERKYGAVEFGEWNNFGYCNFAPNSTDFELTLDSFLNSNPKGRDT
jgi:hypothetical protein